MIRPFVLLALFLVAANADAAKGNGAASPAAQMQSARSGSGGGGGGRAYLDPRKAPPLDPRRKVSEQDCSKPIDLTAGNLKCR
jgi:hypothetical protein